VEKVEELSGGSPYRERRAWILKWGNCWGKLEERRVGVRANIYATISLLLLLQLA